MRAGWLFSETGADASLPPLFSVVTVASHSIWFVPISSKFNIFSSIQGQFFRGHSGHVMQPLLSLIAEKRVDGPTSLK